MAPKIDFDRAFNMDDPISRFGMLTVYFVVGGLSVLMCALFINLTLRSGIETIYKVVLTLLYVWMFGYNVGYKNLKNWWTIYRMKPKTTKRSDSKW